MATITQGDVWWSELPEPRGSEPGYRRPVVVVQGNGFNRSRIRTVVCVPLTTNLDLAELPGTVRLDAGSGGLSRESVANASQIFTADRQMLRRRAGRVSPEQLEGILQGIDEVLGRT